MNVFRFVPGYEPLIYDSGREPALIMLVAFLVTFVCTRAYTRLARVRGWGSAHVGEVHVHHLVVGIVLCLSAGALEFALDPEGSFWQLLLATSFGVGAALVLDEFALVFRLRDVYWATEGRSSIDAVVISATLGALLLLHVVPFEEDDRVSGRWWFAAIVALHACCAVVAALKGKVFTATLGLFVPFVALFGAIRLAKPTSVWARRFYEPGSHRRERAERRFERYDQQLLPLKDKAWDLIGGKVEPEPEPERES